MPSKPFEHPHNRRTFLQSGCVALGLSWGGASPPRRAFAQGPKDPSAEFFRAEGPLPVFKLDVDAEGVASLLKEPRNYVKANLLVGTQRYEQVGLHLKGNPTGSFRPWTDKPAITFNMDKFVKRQTYLGMDKFHLNNSVEDPSFVNERLLEMLFTRVSVPATRAVPVRVELNGRDVGVYVLKEGFDKQFVHRHFANTEGTLFDGGQFKDVSDALQVIQGPESGRECLKALALAAGTVDHKKRLAAFEETLDVTKFISYWCVDVLAAGYDGYPVAKNNFRLFIDGKTKKATFLGHGKDEMFQQPELPLTGPWQGLVARCLYETETGRKRYEAELKRIFKDHFPKDLILKEYDRQVDRISQSLGQASDRGKSYLKDAADHRKKILARFEYLQRKLAA
jgi:hypothetical protein